jgi:oligopeptide transport system substrate-binding protein
MMYKEVKNGKEIKCNSGDSLCADSSGVPAARAGREAASTEATAPDGPQWSEVRSLQTVMSNGVLSRPLAVVLGTEPPTLDFSLARDTTSHVVLGQLMEGLYCYQPDGSLEPAGAVSYTVSSNSQVYTVTLRSDAHWSDGQPVTAQHYEDGVIRMLDPDLGSSNAFLIYLIEGAEDFNTGITTNPNTVGITAVDTHTLRFTLAYPAGHFPSLMAMPLFYPVRMDIINSDPDWTEGGHFVGNGPYVLTEWDHWNRLVLDKNSQYHSAAQVTIERVIFSIITDASDQLTAYENDQLDVSGYPESEYSRIMSDTVLSAEFHQLPRPGVYYLGMNTELTPTSVVTVRKALATAIDRQQLIYSWQEGATSVIPPGIQGYQNEEVGYPFNPTQAQAYLTQAGYPGGVGFPDIELWANYGNVGLINGVADHWRNNLGIGVTTVYTDWGTYLDLLDDCHDNPGACDYNAYRAGWTMDYGDAHNILNDVFHPDSSKQHTGWDNTRYRQLISLSLTETNQLSRTTYFQEADRILVENEAAVIPIFYYNRIALIKSDILFEYPPFGAPRYMNWRFTTMVTDTITDTGGTISSPDRDIDVEFPDGAVSDTIAVTYTSFYVPPHPPTATFAFAGNAFMLEVAEVSSGEPITIFAEPLTVTIKYTDGDLNGQDEETLEFLYWNGSAWVDDGITIVEWDTVSNSLVARIEHLTEFALFGQYRLSLPLILRSCPQWDNRRRVRPNRGRAPPLATKWSVKLTTLDLCTSPGSGVSRGAFCDVIGLSVVPLDT